VARDAEVLAERYERTARRGWPAELVTRARAGKARRWRQEALRGRSAAIADRDAVRSATSSCSTRWGGPRRHRAAARPAWRGACAAYDRRKRNKRIRQGGQGCRGGRRRRSRRGVAPNPQGRQATSVHRGGKRATAKISERAKTIQSLLGDHQDSVVSRTHLSRQAEGRARRRRGHLLPTGLLYQVEDDPCRDAPGEQLGRRVEEAGPVRCAETH